MGVFLEVTRRTRASAAPTSLQTHLSKHRNRLLWPFWPPVLACLVSRAAGVASLREPNPPAQNEVCLHNGLSSPPLKRGSRACPWLAHGATVRPCRPWLPAFAE